MLPRLRKQARLTRAQVVERLSAALGAAGREQKVAGYYHEMEQGTLDSRRRLRPGARRARRDLRDHGREAARDRRAARRPGRRRPARRPRRWRGRRRRRREYAGRGRRASPDPSRWRRRRRGTRSTSCSRAAPERAARRLCVAASVGRASPADPSRHDLQAASRPFLLFRFALREGDFASRELIARALWRRPGSTESTALAPRLGSARDGGDRAPRRGDPRGAPRLHLGRRPPADPDRGDRRQPLRPPRLRQAAGRDVRRARLSRARRRRDALAACCSLRSARSGSTPTRPCSGRRDAGSRSPTSSATTSFIAPASSRCSVARRRSHGGRRARDHPPAAAR